MQVAKVNFNDCIGAELFGGGITEQFVRYCVEGPNSSDPAIEPAYPQAVELHFFNCPGGEVYEGYGIYSYLRTLAQQGIKVTAYVHGLCASIASVIVLAADERLIGPLGQIMTHKPMCEVGPWGNADDHAKAVLELNKLQDQIAGIYALRTGQPVEALHAMMNVETFLYPAEALATGFATGTIPEAAVEPAPQVAAKVLNYAKVPLKPTPAAMATLNATEEQSLFEKFKNWLNPKNEGEPTAVATKVDVTGGDPMYTADAEVGAGSLVYSDEALTTAYPDGDYTLADGREATVLSGAVSEIEAGETNEAPAAPAATNTADEALVAELATLKAENAAKDKLINSLKNKVAKQVPGSAGNPTPPGAANVSTPKNAVAPKAAALAFNIRKN